MPSFTATVAGLRVAGPVFSMQVAVPQAVADALVAGGQPIPAPIQVTAQIDTGASLSVVRTGLPGQLGLQPVGMAKMHTASDADVDAPVFPVRLIFPNNVVADLGTVAEMPIQHPIECLIGRDVLSGAVLVYVGYMNQFTISF